MINLNGTTVSLVLDKADFPKSDHDNTARRQFSTFARRMHYVLQNYIDDDRRTQRNKDRMRPYLELLKKIDKQAQHLRTSEFSVNQKGSVK